MYHHFYFDSARTSVTGLKLQLYSSVQGINLLKGKWSDIPDVISPKGFSVERQRYLYDSIRLLCLENDKDITSPLPSVGRPSSRHSTSV